MKMPSDVAFKYIQYMQDKVMAEDSKITLNEWNNEPIKERMRYYQWMHKQGYFFTVPFWDEINI